MEKFWTKLLEILRCERIVALNIRLASVCGIDCSGIEVIDR